MTQRLPYDQWLLTQTREQLIERDLKKKAREAAKKTKSITTPKTRSTSRKYPYYNRNINGYGPYTFGGKLSADIPWLGIKGSLGGDYYSNDYRAPMQGVPRIKPGTIKGKGPYAIKANSLVGLIDLGMDPPEVRNTNRGEATIFNHREYVGDLKSGPEAGGGTAFNLQTIPLNPGNPSLFPFLAPIAYQFQEYEVRGMLVELKTLSADVTTTLSMGSMFMAADYNVLTPAPTNKQQLENMEYASSAKPSRTLIMPIECERKNNMLDHLMIADNLNYEGTDARTYNLANIYIGSQGIPVADATIAEIWVTYEIALFKPIIGTVNQSISAHLIGQDPTSTLPLGTTVSWVPGSDPRFIQQSANIIEFPPIKGTYLVVYNVKGGSIVTAAAPIMSGGGDMTFVPTPWSSASGNQNTQACASANNVGVVSCVIVETQGNLPTLIFNTTGIMPTSGFTDLVITNISDFSSQPNFKKGLRRYFDDDSEKSSDDESSYEEVIVRRKKNKECEGITSF